MLEDILLSHSHMSLSNTYNSTSGDSPALDTESRYTWSNRAYFWWVLSRLQHLSTTASRDWRRAARRIWVSPWWEQRWSRVWWRRTTASRRWGTCWAGRCPRSARPGVTRSGPSLVAPRASVAGTRAWLSHSLICWRPAIAPDRRESVALWPRDYSDSRATWRTSGFGEL